eukprot:TRINITY_DN2260_c0_g1_i1.p1 TRINITY_DN2260_c0_g1~~TRINITY_DN2260_c0_g1_i1.p1  ORF type:complete len:501 (+),score=125.63 TRINITY_DN2260_c0_g1_i1:101-1603(+)
MSNADSYSLDLSQDTLNYVAKQMTDYAMAQGIMVEVRQDKPAHGRGKRFRTAPFAVCPTPTPRLAFERARGVQPIVNELVAAVAQDDDMLTSALATTCQVDEFTANIFKVYEAGKAANQYGYRSTFANIIRNDFMLHCEAEQDYAHADIYNVEINTIASSFGVLSNQICDMHRQVYGSLNCSDVIANVPENRTRGKLVNAFKEFHEAYCQNRRSATTRYSVVCAMVVQPDETNLCDQRLLEHDLWAEHSVRLVRVTFEDIAQSAKLSKSSALVYTLPTGEHVELSVIYFRAGYRPEDLPEEKHWQARILLEQSNAIKCPNAACHLVGTKKIQQVLSKPEALRKYLAPEQAEQLLSTFTRFKSLDPADYSSSEQFEQELAQVYAHPDDWVLKPQREGGGNNYYGKDAVAKLKTMSQQEASAYILMAMIKPPVVTVVGLSETAVVGKMAATTEFGFYGVQLVVKGETRLNETAGFLMRTKAASSHETGVAAGFGLLDVPMLV